MPFSRGFVSERTGINVILTYVRLFRAVQSAKYAKYSVVPFFFFLLLFAFSLYDIRYRI